jgi:hypothetical protein
MQGTSILDLAVMALAVANSPQRQVLASGLDRPCKSQILRLVANTERAREALAWRPNLDPGREPPQHVKRHNSMSVRWLITGSQGFVGRYASAYIMRSDRDAKVLGAGRSEALFDSFAHTISGSSGKLRAPLPVSLQTNRDPHYSYWQADLQNAHEIRNAFKDFRPDIVLHLASSLVVIIGSI